MTLIINTDHFQRRLVQRKDRSRRFRARRRLLGPTVEVLEDRQLLAATATSNLMNVPVQFSLLPNGHLIEKMGKVQSDLGIVQGLYQGRDIAGHEVAYDVVNNVLREFVPKSQWMAIGTANEVAQNSSGNVFFTQGSTLNLATGAPGVKLPVLVNVSGLTNAGSQAVVQVGSYFEANLTAQLSTFSGTKLQFSNVQMNVGGFAANFLRNALADLQSFTEPLQPLTNALENPLIPGFGFTTSWVMQQLGYGQAASEAETFANAIHAINSLSLPTSVNSAWLTLGKFTAQVQSGTQLVTLGSTVISTAQIDSQLGSISSVLAQFRSIPGLQVAIDDPKQLLKLITGENTTLFSYTLGIPQAISVAVQQPLAAIPVSPVTLTEIDIEANLGFSVSAKATFGFDTSGFKTGNLANGFFIQNASLSASLETGLSGLLNEADLAGYQLTGAVTGSITASLRGANSSGKVYTSQFKSGGITFSPPNWNFGITTQFLGPGPMLTLAIHQFGSYLQELLGADYQIAANILHGDGVTFNDIAVAMGTLYGIPPQTTAGILKKLNGSASQIADALRGAYQTTAAQAVSILSNAGFDVTQVTGALASAFNSTDKTAAYWLNQAGANTTAIAQALASVFGDTDKTAAYWLNQAGANTTAIAQALASVFGDTDQTVAYWLTQAGVDAADIAQALASVFNDADTSAAYWLYEAGQGFNDILTALESVFGDSYSRAYSIVTGLF